MPKRVQVAVRSCQSSQEGTLGRAGRRSQSTLTFSSDPDNLVLNLLVFRSARTQHTRNAEGRLTAPPRPAPRPPLDVLCPPLCCQSVNMRPGLGPLWAAAVGLLLLAPSHTGELLRLHVA
jgi:hypothetical protein